MTVVPSRALGIAALLLLAGCGSNRPDEEGSVLVDSAGVQLAMASAVDRPLGWSLTEVFRLGGADEGPGSFTAASTFNTGTDAAGNLYVFDTQQYRVEVFGPTGEHLRFLGRQGGGPGELEFPISMFVTPPGIVHVFDVAKRSLVRWDANGDLLPPLSMQGVAFGSIRVFGDTVVFDQQVRTPELRSSRLLQVIGTDTLAIDSLSAPGGGMVQFSCVAFAAAPVFAPSLQWATDGRQVAATRQTPYQVDVYRDGVLVRSVRRPITPKPATTEDIARLHPEGMKISFGGGGGCTIPASEIMEKQGVAPHVPQIRGVILDPQGRLWVERYTFADEPDLVDLFNAEGHYLGTLTGKGPPLGFIGDAVVLFAEEDAATGMIQVVAYRVEPAN
ncbi:MAG: hypothetical protein KJZ47_00570 [Gemmatimonadales bacterium]|nr:hypothetical protein [Gemmatimonadales bacterium]